MYGPRWAHGGAVPVARAHSVISFSRLATITSHAFFSQAAHRGGPGRFERVAAGLTAVWRHSYALGSARSGFEATPVVDADHGESESRSRRRRGRCCGLWEKHKGNGVGCRTRRHLRRLPRTEHPPQPAGGLRRRILGVVGSTRRRSARRRTECGCSTARSARRAGQQMAPGQRRSKSGFASNFDPEPTGYARTKSIAHPARTPPHRCASAGTPNYPPDKYDAPRQRQRDAPLALMHASSRLTRQRLHALIVGIGHTRMQYVMPAVRR